MTHGIGAVSRIYTRSVEQKADGCHLFTLAVAESVHELRERSRSLDLEEDLIVIVGHFNVEML